MNQARTVSENISDKVCLAPVRDVWCSRDRVRIKVRDRGLGLRLEF